MADDTDARIRRGMRALAGRGELPLHSSRDALAIAALGKPMKYAIREGADGWERWDNAADTWITLRPDYAHQPLKLALEYCAGYYGIPERRIEIDLRVS